MKTHFFFICHYSQCYLPPNLILNLTHLIAIFPPAIGPPRYRLPSVNRQLQRGNSRELAAWGSMYGHP